MELVSIIKGGAVMTKWLGAFGFSGFSIISISALPTNDSDNYNLSAFSIHHFLDQSFSIVIRNSSFDQAF
jgi:hypothetical protein